MAEVPVSALVALASQFNDYAHQSFPTKESHAAFHALLDENEQLPALKEQLKPFNDEAKAQVETIQSNQPAVNIWAEMGVDDPSQLSDEQKEGIKQMAAIFAGIPPEMFDKPYVPDTEEAAAAKALAVTAATQALEEISERAAPTLLQIQETVTSALKQTLPQEVYEEVASAFEVEAGVSEAYAAHNAPTLAATFAPRP